MNDHGVEQYQLKKQIEQKICHLSAEPATFRIIIKGKNYPVKVSWDSTLFLESCRDKSFITDWCSYGWFDAICRDWTYYIDFKMQNELIIVKDSYDYTLSQFNQNDTLLLTYLAIASEKNINFLVANRNYNYQNIKIFPNPVSSILHIQSESDVLTEITVLDLRGNKYWTTRQSEIDVSALKPGIYLLRIDIKENTQYQVIIKN
jgi:hypothetical protein